MTKVRTDAVMLISIGVLFAVGVLDAKEMCSGFSAGTVVVTGVLGVVMAGLRYTGVLQWIMRHVFGLPDRYPTALLRMTIPVAALSAFLRMHIVPDPLCMCGYDYVISKSFAFDKNRYYEGSPNPRLEKLRQGKCRVDSE